MPTQIIPVTSRTERPENNDPFPYLVVIDHRRIAEGNYTEGPARLAAEAHLIAVPTQPELDAAIAGLAQRAASIESRAAALENSVAEWAVKHVEMLKALNELPESLRIQLMKDALQDWVSSLVREEVQKALAGGQQVVMSDPNKQ